jgi:DNA-binding SARP family transcriptional activator/tetratricopeptide (TPR) repeat protein
VQFRLLGAIEVTVDGQPIPIGYAQLRWMLAVLLIEANHPVSIDHLIDRVWATQRLPRRPRHAVQHNIPLLRRALAPAPGVTLARSGAGYQLSTDPDSIDSHRFRTLLGQSRAATLDQNDDHAAVLLDEALTLWRCEPFADVDIDTPWLQTQRAMLTAHHHSARLDLTDIRLRQGRHGVLLAELAAQVTQHPVDERLAGQYLLALYRNGRQAQALEHYQHLQHRLAEELGVDPSPPLQHLHRQILTADAAIAVPVPVAPPPTAPPLPVPRQLPGPPRLFTGRTTELAELDKALDEPADTAGTVVISAIGGAGGLGKTWLALHWAHQHLDRFPDGQLFVDLQGFSPAGAPTRTATAVRGFLDAFGVDPGRIPADLDAQAALYRSLAAGRRMLIVLDNAADADQVVPLLPGSATCTVLVTSRRTLTTLITRHDARHLPLGTLDEDEAHALLTERLGEARVAAEPGAVAELARLCGQYPLALAVMASRAQACPDLPLADIAADVRDAGLDALDDTTNPGASLPTVLSWSVRELPDQERVVFALLSIAPGPDISLPAAASLTGMPERDCRMVLRDLQEASLVDRRPGGRYAMHDVIRAYAAAIVDQELTAQAREAALRRVLDFYTHTAHAADRLLNPNRPPVQLNPPAPDVHPQPPRDVPAVLAWFDTEHPTLLAAQHMAAGHAWHDTVWQLAWALHTFQHRRGHRHDRLTVWCAAMDATTHLSDSTPRTYAHQLLGYAYADLGRHQEGIEHLRHALALAEKHHDLDQQAHTHRILARAWHQRGEDRRALEHATHTLNLYRALDQPVWEANALNAVGWYAARLGEYETARTHCQTALALHQQHHDPENEAATLDSLGYIAHHSGHHEHAIGYYQQALTRLRALGGTSEAANTLDRIGHPYVALGRHEQARVVWREALELYRQMGNDIDAERVRGQLDALDQHSHAH